MYTWGCRKLEEALQQTGSTSSSSNSSEQQQHTAGRSRLSRQNCTATQQAYRTSTERSPALAVANLPLIVITKQNPTLHAAAHLLAQARVTSGLSSHADLRAHLWLNARDKKHLQAAAE
jgi:hypothetical protein